MVERRRYKRFDLSLNVTYQLEGWGERYTCITKNISGGGVCLIMDTDLKDDTRIDLRLPSSDADKNESIAIKAQKVWSREVDKADSQFSSNQRGSSLSPWKSPFAAPLGSNFGRSSPRFEIGMKFIELDSDMVMNILKYISSNISTRL